MCISFHPLTPADKSLVQERVYHTECRNCDLNFMNLVSWRFMYDTEVALHRDFLLFRFKADGHLAYLAPVGTGNWKAVLHDMMADAAQLEHPFLMLGVCENALAQLDVTMPGYFYATADRAFTDYIYSREKLASLAGKKLQPKRNYVNRFTKLYPDFTTEPLTSKDIDECIALDAQWVDTKAAENEAGRYTFDAERQSLITALKHWDVLEGRGWYFVSTEKSWHSLTGLPSTTTPLESVLKKPTRLTKEPLPPSTANSCAACHRNSP